MAKAVLPSRGIRWRCFSLVRQEIWTVRLEHGVGNALTVFNEHDEFIHGGGYPASTPALSCGITDGRSIKRSLGTSGGIPSCKELPTERLPILLNPSALSFTDANWSYHGGTESGGFGQTSEGISVSIPRICSIASLETAFAISSVRPQLPRLSTM